MCSGHGCSECDGGQFGLDECPNRFCDEVADLLMLYDCFEKGLLPVAGGVLDQSAYFVTAARRIANEEALIRQDR